MIMAIVKHNMGTDFSGVSVVEASYIVNNYIEESFNDLQIKCLMVDNRSLQESGVRYFTEENEAGQKKLSEKIKGIFEAVWNGIVGIFTKIKDFFGNLIVNFKVKAADPKNKDIVKNASDNDISKIVKDKISVYYDLNRYGKALDRMAAQTGKNIITGRDGIKGGLYEEFSSDMETAKLEGESIKITKDDLLASAFGEFRNQYKDVQNKFKTVEKAFKAIKDKTDAATRSVYDEDDEIIIFTFKSVKETLKALNAYSAGYSKMIIHNAKMLVKVVNMLVKNSKETQATKESVSWDFVF